jgi:HEAT repeat protein
MKHGAGMYGHIRKVMAVVLALICIMSLSSCMQRKARLFRQIGSEDEAERKAACQSLVEMGREVVKPMINALKKDSITQGSAAEVLGGIGDTAAVEPLMTLLQGPETVPEVKQKIIIALGRLKDGRAAPLLVKMLLGEVYDGVNTLEAPLTEALAGIGQPSIKPLVEELNFGAPSMAGRIRNIIVKMGDSAVPDLIPIVKDKTESEERRANVIIILRDLKGDGIFEALQDALSDQSQNIRYEALKSLIMLNDQRGRDVIIGALKDPYAEIREMAAAALGNFKGGGIFEVLQGVLADENKDVRGAALKSIIMINDERGRDILIGALKDSDAGIREMAAAALGNLKGEGIFEALTGVLADQDRNVRCAAVKSIIMMNDPRGTDVLIGALKDSDDEIRRLTVIALGKINDPKVIEPLGSMLGDKNDSVWKAAADSLLNLGEAGVNGLVAGARKFDAETRMKIVSLLDEMNDIRAIAPLTGMLGDQDESVWKAAENSIKNKYGKDGVLGLVAALKNPDAAVRKRAVIVLADLSSSEAFKALSGSIFEALAGALSDKDRNVRLEALDLLTVMNDPRCNDAIMAALKDPDAEIRELSVSNLADLDDPRVIGALVGMLRDKAENVWKAAVDTLLYCGDEGEQKLIASLGAENIGLLYNNHDYFIRLGISGSEAVLIKALNKYNSKNMAIDFLNCGNSELDKAARAWASRRGYRVVQTGTGGGGPVWGSE